MSVAVQLNMFPEAQDDLQAAVDAFSSQGVKHEHFSHFIDELVTSFKSCRAGSTIVAACPGGQATDEVLGEFVERIRNFEIRTHRGPSNFGFLRINAPSGLSTHQVNRELIDRYRTALHQARICHRTKPRYSEECPGMDLPKTATGHLVDFILYKNPQMIVVTDADKLARDCAPPAEIRAIFRVIMDIASQSGVTHMICCSPYTLLKLLKDAEFAAAIEPHILRPYDYSEVRQKSVFAGILADYDEFLPWAGDDALSKKHQIIDDVVAGDPERVRRWILKALNGAIAAKQTRLEWSHFEATIARPVLVASAQDERCDIIEAFPAKKTAKPTASLPKANDVPQKPLKPGQRKDTRDPANMVG